MFSTKDELKDKRKLIDKYLEISDRINAPILIEDDTTLKSIEEPYAFIQPQLIDLTEFDISQETNFSISNAGTGLLIISSISSDVDWIKIDDSGGKKVLECSDDPFLIKIKIEKEKLPAGDHNGIITIQTMQDTKTIHQIPISVHIPKEDSALVVPSKDVLDFGSVTLHKEAEFTFTGSSEDSIPPSLGGTRLVYLQGDFTNWELSRISMSRVGDLYFTILPLEDGEYLYQFSFDGREFPDPNNQQMVVIGEHGNCSKLTLNRYSRDFFLTKVGTKSSS
jgi:hypothetical protein